MTKSTVKRALLTWAVGRNYLDFRLERGAAVVMIERREHLDEVLASGVAGAGSVMLVPKTFVEYEGDAAEPVGEISVGDDVFVQLQDYATAEYMSLIGPTILRLTSEVDLEVYLQDLDASVGEGRFPEYLIHPAVQLADPAGLRGVVVDDGVDVRLHLDRDGRWSTSACGSAIGSLGDGWDVLALSLAKVREQSDLPCPVALSKNIPEETRLAALRERPWAGYFLAAQAAVKNLTARHIENPLFSGFGGRLAPELQEWPTVSAAPTSLQAATSPILAWDDARAYFFAPQTGRMVTMRLDSAVYVEALLTFGSLDAAARTGKFEEQLLVSAAEQLVSVGLLPGSTIAIASDG